MLSSDSQDLSMYTGKVRVRVCGLLANDDKLLLIKHNSLGSDGELWAPPGGGVEFGESTEQALKREFLEETGLIIEVSKYLFVFELINEKHHAIELFYEVSHFGGELKLGADPEFDVSNQIISDMAFLSFHEIGKLNPERRHDIFNKVNIPEKVFDLRGLFRFKH